MLPPILLLVWFIPLYYVILRYVVSAVRIRFLLTSKAHPRFEVLDGSGMPEAAAEYLYNLANALRQDGFTPEAYLAQPDQMPPVRSYLIMLTNRAAGDRAMVTVIMAYQPGKTPRIMTNYTEFSTQFVSGKIVDTLNSKTLGVFKRVPGNLRIQPTQIQDPHLLYQIHRHAVAQFAGIASDDSKVVYPEGQSVRYLSDLMTKQQEEQEEFGLLYRDEENGNMVFRLTWYGAFYTAWQHRFPFNVIKRWKTAQRANAVLRSFRETTAQPTRP